MAKAQKGDSSSVNLKEKESLLDMDIGKDFLTSWKSMSMAEGDGMDFDLTPVPKGNKKSFQFGKADMDFNLDGDFGKISSFNIDMSDLDISPPFKKDAKSKESKESSSGKDKGKKDRFAFAFDFDELDNFNFESSPKEDSKARKGKDNRESFPNESVRQDKEDDLHMKLIGSKSTLDNFKFESSPEDDSKARKDKDNKESFPSESVCQDKDDMHMKLIGSKSTLDNFNLESSPEEDSKARKDKDNKESFPNESACQDKEDDMHTNLIGSKSTLEEVPRKSSLDGTETTFDIDSLVGGSADLEPTRKTFPSILAMDDDVTSEPSAAIDEVAYDKEKITPESTNAPMELLENSQFKKLVPPKTVDLEARNGTDAVQDLSFDTLSNNEPRGGNSSETKEKVDSIDTNATISNGEKAVNMIAIAGSTYISEQTMSDNPKRLQTNAISEKNSGEKTQVGLENHVIDNFERTELGQVNSLVEKSRTASDVSRVLCDTPPGRENQEPASKILNLSLVSKSSQPADQLEKETMNRRENRVTCSRFFVQTEKPECPVQKLSTQTTFSSLGSKQMGSIQPNLVEGRRDHDSIQSDKKQVSLPLQDSKTPLRRELPQIRSKESSNGLKICGEVSNADGLQNGKKLNGPSTTEIKDVVKTKSALRQTEASMKDLYTLSLSLFKHRDLQKSSTKQWTSKNFSISNNKTYFSGRTCSFFN